MQSIYVFRDKAKFSNFWWKNPDVIRKEEVCHVIYIIFESFLGKLKV